MGIKNLFGLLPKSGKDSSYVVQFDESQNGKSVEVKQPATAEPAKETEPAAEPATAETAKAETVTVEPAKEAEPATAETATTKPAKQKKTRAEIIEENKARSKTGKPKKAKVQPAKTESAKPQPSQPVAAKSAPTASEPPSTFAPTYLNPAASLNGGRRRPGANMKSFMDMARQVKKPKVKS